MRDEDRVLTPEGHELALRFGSRLPRRDFVLVNHSPVPRCRETATDIVEGYLRRHPGLSATVIGEKPWLAAFHYFCVDRYAMEARKAKTGAKQFLREWIGDRLPPGIMHPASQAIEVCMNEILRELRAHEGPTWHVYIGHDFGLTLLREALFGGKFEELPWIGYLDGFAVLLGSAGGQEALWWNAGIQRVVW